VTTAQQQTASLAPITSEFLFEYDIALRPTGYDFGQTPSGHLRIGYVEEGKVDGPRIKATVLEATDYPVIRPDDTAVPNCKAVLQTDDGELILMSYTGVIGPWSEFLKARLGQPHDPDAIAWKIQISFETSSEKYAWLNRTMAVGRGAFAGNGFHYEVYSLI
jgi:hypothetical protein